MCDLRFDLHHENPYVTGVEAAELAERAGLRRAQVRKWLANMRSRHRFSASRFKK